MEHLSGTTHMFKSLSSKQICPLYSDETSVALIEYRKCRQDNKEMELETLSYMPCMPGLIDNEVVGIFSSDCHK